MDERQVRWVGAAIGDELARDGVHLTREREYEIGDAATRACINWMVQAAKAGLIESVDGREP
jgi:hypothetical protein